MMERETGVGSEKPVPSAGPEGIELPAERETETREVGPGVCREIDGELALLDPFEAVPSEEKIFEKVKASSAYKRELFSRWNNEHALDEALRAEIKTRRERFLETQKSARGIFKSPDEARPN
jgi:hypothetical protein